MTQKSKGGTKRTVLIAGAANLIVALIKVVAGILTSSSAMLAEAAHSVADTLNQALLLTSINRARKPADDEHPFGYGQERYFWSLLAAFGIFVLGAGFSVFEGILALGRSSESGSVLIAYIVLVAAGAAETTSFIRAYRQMRGEARQEHTGLLEHVKSSPDTTVKAALFEDSAAIVGLVLAAAGIGLRQLTGSGVWDGAASIAIGVLLVVVAVRLGMDNRDLLIGRSANSRDLAAIREEIESTDGVDDLFELLTMHLGPDHLIVAARLSLADGLSANDTEDLADQIDRRLADRVPEVSHVFIDPTPREAERRERAGRRPPELPPPPAGLQSASRPRRHDTREDHGEVTGSSDNGLFGALFARGGADTGDRAWLQAMLDTEAALARALERAGLAPTGSGAAVTAVAHADFFDNGALSEAAASTGNPVPALVRALTELLPESAAAASAAVHRGATSQDVIDTAAMLLARSALDAILADLATAAASCAAHACTHAETAMPGRTLLQQAVPVTFGLVAAGWLTAIDEARRDLHRVRTGRLAVQFGGAAGTLAALGDAGPAVAALLGEELGLPVPVLPWHTNRLRIVELAAALAGACAALGKIARDVTLLAQTEVAEVREDPGAGRGGSSAMPHKQNPVAAVLVLGCARQAPGLLATLAAAAEQEHQRAAGAWHAEWLPLSDLLTRTASAASWSADLLSGLRIDPARMRANLDATGGSHLAENITTLLAPALGRIPAHDLVANASARAAETGVSLTDALFADAEPAARLAEAALTRPELESALRPESYLGATAEFIRRALSAHADCDQALSN